MSRAATRRTHRTRRLITSLGGCALALMLACTVVTSPAAAAGDPSGPQLAGLKYVALGDSYSAGYGLTPYSTTWPADGCFQADANYPHQVASDLGLTLTDVTCSNAVTENITTTPQNTGLGIAPIQADALKADTDIVTVTIGGNDLGFAVVAASCLALSANGPLMFDWYANNCKQFYQHGGYDVLALRINNIVVPALANTLKIIAQKSPHAKVFVIGYPAIAPDRANTPEQGCFTSAITYTENSYPFTDADVPYLYQVESLLDTAIGQQAAAAGATFIPTIAQTAGHSPCAPAGQAYMNGITFTDGYTVPMPPDPLPAPGPGTPTGPSQSQVADAMTHLKIGALHPNAAGVAFLGEQVATAIRTAFAPAEPSPTPSASSSAVAPADSTTAARLAESGSNEVGWLGFAGLLLLLGAGAMGLRRSARVPD